MLAPRLTHCCLRLFGTALLIQSCLTAQGPGFRIVVVEGDNAINNVSQRTTREPVVRIEEDGRPVAGAIVTFQLPNTGPGGTFLDGKTLMAISTEADGLAVGRGLRPNAIVGQFTIRVTASYRGETASADITQTNAAPARAAKSPTRKILIIGLIAGAAGGGILAATHGKSTPASTTASTPGSVVVTPGDPGFGPPH